MTTMASMNVPSGVDGLSPDRIMNQTVSFAVDGLGSPSPIKSKRVKSTTPGTLQQQANRSLSTFTPVRPVFTPKAKTPLGSQGHILLSPSRTITESLQALAASTVQQLEEVWDEVGYNSEERASQISDLLIKLKDLCESKIYEEMGVSDQFRKAIADAKFEIQSTAGALKSMVDPELLSDAPGQPLAMQLEALEIALEDLRESAQDAKSHLKEAQDFLLESHQALGWTMDEAWLDIESDLTLSRRKEFDSKVEEMKQELSTRTATVIQLLRDCQHLMNELSIEGQNSESAIDRKIAGSLIRAKDGNLVIASKYETDTCTGISSKAMESLMNRVTELSNEKRQRRTKLQELGTAIAFLWDQLRISEEDKRAFTESVKGLALETIERGEMELGRLQAMKADMMGKLIAQAREEIVALWEKTNATSQHQESFRPFFVEDERLFDDVLLEQHESYVSELEHRLEKMQPIIRNIEKREEIIHERMEYEELQKNSNRLKERNAAMAKQLQKEEKMARRIKSLPKFTKLLEEKLQEWRVINGEDFMYNGEVYIDVMKNQQKEWEEYKANELELKSRRKQEQGMDENNAFGRSGGAKHTLPAKKKAPVRPLGTSHLGNSTVATKVYR